MVRKSLLFPTTRQDKALSKAYFDKTESPKPKEAKEVEPTKLSAEEIQHYVDILLEASKPAESVDLTMQILLKRFPKQD